MTPKNSMFFLALLFMISWSAATHQKSSLVCNARCSGTPKSECRLASPCQNCQTSGLKCYDTNDVEYVYRNNFDDYFCGTQGVVVYDASPYNPQNLSPLKCNNGNCPADSTCLRNPSDNNRYCCARVPDDRKCQEISLYSQGSRRDERMGEDSDGRSVQIISMQILEEYPDSKSCTLGSSYGYFGSNVYSDGGCKASFLVCYDLDSEEALTSISPGADCKLYTLRSTKTQSATKIVTDSNNNPVQVVYMGLVRQISDLPCVESNNYYFRGYKIVAKDGCKAVFQVCYGPYATSSTPAPFTSTSGPGEACVNVNLFSRINRVAEKTITDAKGNPVTITRMTLTTQHSDLPCERGDSFSFSGSLAQSSKGCRATFRICYIDLGELTAPPGQSCSEVNLFSRIARPVEKTITDANGNPVPITSMTLVKQHSDIACTKGDSFDFSFSVARANQGCRGTFYICYEDPSLITTVNPNEPTCKRVVLRSTENEPDQERILNANNNPAQVVSMDLVRRLSNTRCVEYYNYYFSGSLVVAKQGCQAVFKVCYEGNPYQTTAPFTEEPEPGQTCIKVNLFSRINREAEKVITDELGNAVTIRSMTLVFQHSDIACVRGDSFSFSFSVAKSTKGCRGSFRICYDNEGQFTSPPGQACEEVNLFSRIARVAEKTITDVNGSPATITSMVLVLQHSDIACTRGDSFSFSGSVARSTKGCRGTFYICHADTSLQTTVNARNPICKRVRLESTVNQPAIEKIVDNNNNPVEVISMDLVKRLSTVNCIQDYNYYFYGGFKVTATNGCKAVFRVCYERPFPTTPLPLTNEPESACKIVELRSTQNQPAKKGILDAFNNRVQVISMDVVRQLSLIRCVEWHTYFFNGHQVVANGGCQAIFKVCYQGQVATTPAAFTEEPEQGQECVRVNLFSRINREAEKTITDGQGNPVTITSMTVYFQHSDIPCVSGDSYSFSGSVAKSTKGCRASFRICYYDEGQFTAPPGQICNRINLFSRIARPAEQTITDVNGNPVPIISMTLAVQHSDVECVQGNSFTYSGSVARSTKGCRGTFYICYDDSSLFTSPNPNDRVCKRVTLRSTEKNAATRSFFDASNNPAQVVSMDIVKRLSNVRCVRSYNFYFTGNRAVAKDGCQAVFKVCYERDVSGTTAPLTEEPGPGEACVRVNLFSRVNRVAEQTITDPRGNVVTIQSMRLVFQHSDIPCVRGDSFSFSGSLARSSKGCRGSFQICYNDLGELTSAPGQECNQINLFSRVNRPARETVKDASGTPVTIRSMTLVTQHSDVECVRGTSFRYAGSVAQSTKGCRGTFLVCYDSQAQVTTANPNEPSCKRIVLKSTEKDPATKRILDANNKPAQIVSLDLVKKLSNIRCVEWYDYFFRGNKVVVRNGCQGVFKVCYQGETVPTNAPLTQEPEPGEACVKVNLFSRVNHDAVKTITDPRGNEVTIRSMTLLLQHTDVVCRKGDTFRYSGSVAKSSKGCRGTFRICYDDESKFTSEPGKTCSRVNLFSRVNRPAEETIKDASGNPVTITSMTLVTQHTDVNCVRGDTFRFSGSVARSTKGCRGTFNICYDDMSKVTVANPNEPACKRVVLKSTEKEPAVHKIVDANNNPVPVVSMDLVKKLSKVRCVEWYNYYFRGSKVYAKDGCQAAFKVCYEKPSVTQRPLTDRPGPNQKCIQVNLFSRVNSPAQQTITDDKGNRVTIQTLVLIKQHTQVPCVRGDSFSFSGSVARSSKGCRGTFRVCYDNEAQITTPSPNEPGCEKVTIRSRLNKPQEVEITDKRNRRVNVVSVRVVKQISNVPCVERRTFSFKGSKVKATDGCSAVFKVCYKKK